MDTILSLYPWIKALHIIAVISWMAGLLYLPRLFVYHCEAAPGSESSERFKVMERRLLRVIMTPAMIATWLFGLILIGIPGLIPWDDGWMWVKLGSVVLLTGVHHVFAAWVKRFAADGVRHAPRVYRMMNEAPTLLMILVVVMVIVRPF